MSEKKSIEELLKQLALTGEKPKSMEEYKFWKTQPVAKFGESEEAQEGPIEHKTVDQVRQEPYPLHESFEWATLDLNSAEHLDELHTLLYDHYVEDHDAAFRFAYSKEFFNWALKPPGWKSDWHLAVRVKANGKLVAFISGVPCDLNIKTSKIKSVEINFLCVHKQLRSKRLAPLLIKEITRRVNLCDIWQALYTSGTILPTPMATARYTHRPINWDNLYRYQFSSLPQNETKSSMIAKYTLSNETKTKGWRPIELKDVDAVFELYDNFRQKYLVNQIMSKEEVKHWFYGGEKYQDGKKVHAFVVEDAETGEITDFISFYVLPFTVLSLKEELGVAYLFYYAVKDVDNLKSKLKSLVYDAMVESKKLQVDVFNALTTQDNALFIEDLQFGPGDGQLNYYLFNYRMKQISGGDISGDVSDVGVVLL